MRPTAARQPRLQRLGPGTTIWIPPRNRVRAPWGVVAAPSRVPSARPPPWVGTPPPVRGRREPHGGVAGAGARFAAPGARRGLSWEAALGKTPRPPLPAPHTKAPTETAHLPARAGSGRRRTGGQAGWREDVRARVCVYLRVSL